MRRSRALAQEGTLRPSIEGDEYPIIIEGCGAARPFGHDEQQRRQCHGGHLR